MKKRVKDKKAEGPIGMSFSMIMSVILIVLFILIAFMAIRYFLRLYNCTQIGTFADDLQAKVTETWNSQKIDFQLSKPLSSGIEYVCFANLQDNLRGESKEILDEIEFFQGGSKSNMFFYPKEKACDMPSIMIKHLDIGKITKSKNPYCIAVENGIIRIKIQKDFLEELVTVSCVNEDCSPVENDSIKYYTRARQKNATQNYSVNQNTKEKEKNLSFDPIDICNLINDSADRRICSNAVGSQGIGDSIAKGIDQCNEIAEPTAKSQCFSAVYEKYKDVNPMGTQRDLSLCEEFNNDPVQKDLCIRHMNVMPN